MSATKVCKTCRGDKWIEVRVVPPSPPELRLCTACCPDAAIVNARLDTLELEPVVTELLAARRVVEQARTPCPCSRIVADVEASNAGATATTHDQRCGLGVMLRKYDGEDVVTVAEAAASQEGITRLAVTRHQGDGACHWYGCQEDAVWMVTFRVAAGWRAHALFCIEHEKAGRA